MNAGATAAVNGPRAPVAPLLEVRSIRKTYRRGSEDVHALRGAELDLRSAEVVALMGRSGSGKSTLLSIICGWERADDGDVRWVDGSPEVPAIERMWSDLSIVPQRLGLIDELSVRENVALPIRLARGGDAGTSANGARVQALLEALGLDALAERRPAEVSIGEQQRTAMARALVLQPKLLLADEPTGHQDEAWAKGVLALVRHLAHRGTACLLATHNEEVIRFADRVLAIRDGIVSPA